eukprot:scaffold154586_cov23-Tisochrysis_lutea.AAC.3
MLVRIFGDRTLHSCPSLRGLSEPTVSGTLLGSNHCDRQCSGLHGHLTLHHTLPYRSLKGTVGGVSRGCGRCDRRCFGTHMHLNSIPHSCCALQESTPKGCEWNLPGSGYCNGQRIGLRVLVSGDLQHHRSLVPTAAQ